MKNILTTIAVLAAVGNIAHAPCQAVPIQPPSLTSVNVSQQEAELDQVVALAKLNRLMEKRLDWKEAGTTTQDIIAHTKAKLGDEGPLIEIRGQDESRSTFTLQQAPLGAVLSSLAELSGDKVWLFPNRFLLSSHSALSQDEKSAVGSGQGRQWGPSFGMSIKEELRQATTRFVIAQIKNRLAAIGQTAPIEGPPLPDDPNANFALFASYQLPFQDLDAKAQQALQELLNASHDDFYDASDNGHRTIAPDVVVAVDDRSPGMSLVFLKGWSSEKSPFKTVGWDFEKE